MTLEEIERPKFEKYMKAVYTRWVDVDFMQDKDGEYINFTLQSHWNGWLACARDDKKRIARYKKEGLL